MMALKQMITPIRIQVQSLVLRSTGVRLANSGGENKAKGFSQSPKTKGTYMKEISDEEYLMKEWPVKPHAYGMNIILPIFYSDVQETLASVYAMEGMLTGAILMLFIARMAKRLTYGAQISKSDHDVICEELKMDMKKSAQEEISKLKLQIQSAQEEISKLKHSNKTAQKEIIDRMSHELQIQSAQKEIKKLKLRHELQMQSAQEEINELKNTHKSAQEEISELKHSHELQKKSAQEEISALKQSHELQKKSAQEEISELKQSHKLQKKSAQEEINELKQINELQMKIAREELNDLKHSHKLQILKQGKRWKV